MKNPMNIIIEQESLNTKLVDSQIPNSHIHKTYPVSDENIYAFACDCGAVFDEQGEQIK